MKKPAVVILTLLMAAALLSCKQEVRQGAAPMQYFFSGEIISADQDCLLIQVTDTGNSNLSDGCIVEVSARTTGQNVSPDFSPGEYAKVLLEQNVEDNPPERLEALSIYEIDESGGIITDTEQHNFSKDGELPISTTSDGDVPFTVAKTITANSERITITNHCNSQISAYLYADSDLKTAIKKLVIDSGKTGSFTGLTTRFLYKVIVTTEKSDHIDVTIQEYSHTNACL